MHALTYDTFGSYTGYSMSHLNDAPLGKATAQGNVKGQRSRGDALPAGNEGSHDVLSSKVAISGLMFPTIDSCISNGTKACMAGSQATHTLLAVLLPSCMMLPLPKRAFISFITASSALACNHGNYV